MRVERQVDTDVTKSGEPREVDLAAVVVNVLRGLKARRQEDSLRRGGSLSPWVVFEWLPETPSAADAQKAAKRVRRAMARALQAAGLPEYFTPHALRHTFCSLLISSSVSPVYVQQQAGHADVSFTVRVYGSWFAAQAPGAVDRLAEGIAGAIVVTNSARVATSADLKPAQALPPTGTYASGSLSRPSPG